MIKAGNIEQNILWLYVSTFFQSPLIPPMCLWPHLVVEEVHRVVVEFQWQGLEEGDVVGHDLLVREVKLVDDDGVHVVVRQEVIWGERRELDGLVEKRTEHLQLWVDSLTSLL